MVLGALTLLSKLVGPPQCVASNDRVAPQLSRRQFEKEENVVLSGKTSVFFLLFGNVCSFGFELWIWTIQLIQIPRVASITEITVTTTILKTYLSLGNEGKANTYGIMQKKNCPVQTEKHNLMSLHLTAKKWWQRTCLLLEDANEIIF